MAGRARAAERGPTRCSLAKSPPRSLLLTHALLLGARPRAWGFRHTVGLPSANTHSITSRRGKGSAPTTAIWSLAPGAARDGPPQRHQGPAPPGSLWHCTAGSRRLRGAARQTPWVRGQGERTKWWSCRPRRVSVGVHWGARLSLNGTSLPGASDVLLGQEGATPEPHGLGPWQGLAPQGKREVLAGQGGQGTGMHAEVPPPPRKFSCSP